MDGAPKRGFSDHIERHTARCMLEEAYGYTSYHMDAVADDEAEEGDSWLLHDFAEACPPATASVKAAVMQLLADSAATANPDWGSQDDLAPDNAEVQPRGSPEAQQPSSRISSNT
eukprot:gene461-727_t